MWILAIFFANQVYLIFLDFSFGKGFHYTVLKNQKKVKFGGSCTLHLKTF